MASREKVKVKAVYFDAGETLIYRNPSLESITSSYLKKGGYKVNLKKLTETLKLSALKMKAIVGKGVMRDSEKWDFYMADVFKTLKIKDEKLRDELKIRLRKGTSFRVYDDVAWAVKKLRSKGIKTGIISNAPRELHEILENTGVKKLFEHIIVSEDTGYEKPDKRIFDMAVKKAKVKKGEFVYVGDNYIADIKGSVNAGIIPVWIVRKSKNAHFSFDAEKNELKAHKVKNMKELFKVLEGIV